MTGNLPDSPTSTLEFSIYTKDSDQEEIVDEAVDLAENFVGIPPGDFDPVQNSSSLDFTPVYYPSRFTITTEKEFERTAAACDGERVSIKKLKDSELHVTGKVHQSDLDSLWQLSHTSKPVEVITPVIKEGGMEAYVKSVEQGEVVGYDAYPDVEEWMFKYTIDLVSTGKDEYNSSSESNYTA